MIFLILSSLALAAQSAVAGPYPTIDKIEVLKCTVTQSETNSSYIPPQVGDTILFATWQLNINELQFERGGNSPGKPYVSLPIALERVDHSGFRNENLRTFVGISESLAGLTRAEAYLTLQGSEAKIAATYAKRVRGLPDGSFRQTESITMSCTVEKLWGRKS